MTGREDDTDTERRVRDSLTELTERPQIGGRLLSRIGARAWERPNVAISSRLYRKYRVLDPWDPNASEAEELPIALGPVSLRLGEDRRQPAPHLTPKEPAKAAASTARALPPSSIGSSGSSGEDGGEKSIWPPGFRPPRGVPEAKPRGYTPPPPPPRPQPTATTSGPQARGLAAPLPVRPDMAAQIEAQKTDQQKRAPRARPSPAAAAVPPRRPALMTQNPNLPTDSDPSTSTSSGGGGGGGGSSMPEVDRRPPMPIAAIPKGRAGRLSMRSTPVTAPVITAVEDLPPPPAPEASGPPPEVLEQAPAPEPPPKPPPQRVARAASADSLDDLFGFAAQEGRMRLGRKKKDEG